MLQNYPKIPPKDKKVRKTKFENKTAHAKANPEQNPSKRYAKRHVIWIDGSAMREATKGRAKQVLAVWNGLNMTSCNVVHACGRQ